MAEVTSTAKARAMAAKATMMAREELVAGATAVAGGGLRTWLYGVRVGLKELGVERRV